jgi:hypothetical protein
VAIVLIFGSAVILVFANTLNSWVLGGLIGGLAALLISIPISLSLFTILSRHHDQKLQALQQEQVEMGYADLNENGYAEVFETDFYVLRDEEEYSNEPVSRRMSDVRALPAAGQSQASASANAVFNERTGRFPQGSRRPSQALPQSQSYEKGTPTQNLSSDRYQQRRSAHEVNAMRSRFQTAALRAARREAAQQFDRQPRPAPEWSQHQQAANQNGTRPGRRVDATSGPQNMARRTISSRESNAAQKTPSTDSLRKDELQIEQLRGRYPNPETEPFRVRPQTGQIARNPQLGEQLRNPDIITGNLKNPMVRRAPYMYEDDPLREELAQQLDGGPIARRSSLFLQSEDEEE